MRPLFLVESQDAAANAGLLSVYLTTILYYHSKLFFDIEREYTRLSNDTAFQWDLNPEKFMGHFECYQLIMV